MKKLAIGWIMVVVLSLTSYAQTDSTQTYYEEPSAANFWEKVTVGGNFNLLFGNLTFVEVSPTVGYRFTDRFTAGPGVTYRYMKFRGFQASSLYGARVFARQRFGQQFFVQTELESLNTQYRTGNLSEPILRTWVPGFFLGGGLFQPVGRRAGIIISAMYNLIYDVNRSPYRSAWNFNVGFTL